MTPALTPETEHTVELLRAFFVEHPLVALSEAGQRLAQVGGDHSGYALHPEPGRLVGHFWGSDANLVRRITGVRAARPDRLELEVVRLGQKHPARLVLSASAADRPSADREAFREAVLAAVHRDWREWSPAPGSTAGKGALRFLFRAQDRLMVCAAIAEEEGAAAVLQTLAHTLAWAEQCRERDPRRVLAAIRLIVPEGGEVWLRLLRGALRASPAITCYHLDRSAGTLEPVALSDAGNTAHGLRRAPSSGAPAGEAAALFGRVRNLCPQATWEVAPDGTGYISVYGLCVARQNTDTATPAAFIFGYGIEQTPLLPATEGLFTQWLTAVANQRVAGAGRAQPLFALQPEAWMAHVLRHDPAALDAQLSPERIHAQVPMLTPTGTGVLDLLAVGRADELIVIELKASECLEFPLQALLYWQQVRQHQAQHDFERLGYFGGRPLNPQTPRLWLIAPALRWHPLTPLLRRWLSPEVPCTLIGLNEEWRERLQIIFRERA